MRMAAEGCLLGIFSAKISFFTTLGEKFLPTFGEGDVFLDTTGSTATLGCAK